MFVTCHTAAAAILLQHQGHYSTSPNAAVRLHRYNPVKNWEYPIMYIVGTGTQSGFPQTICTDKGQQHL